MLDFARDRTGARRAWIGVGAPIVGLVALIIALALFMLATFAREQDNTFAEASRTLVANSLTARARSEAQLGLDYANWNEAFENVSRRWNQDWVENNIYSSVAEGMILFRTDGTVRFSWFNEEVTPQGERLAAAAVAAAARVPGLRGLGRASTPAETAAYTYARDGDNLIAIGVAPVTLEDNAERIARNPLRGYDYLAVIEVITREDMELASASMSLADLRFVAAPGELARDMIALPVIAADGTRVGELQWRHARPGAVAFRNNAWRVVVSLLLIGALTIWIARRLVVRQISAMAYGEAALESSRLKAEFLARVGHELRTPIDGIIGYAEMIQEETDSGTTRADAGRIIESARRLNHMLSDILDQSRLDAGRIKLNNEVLPVAGMLAEVQGLTQSAARSAGVSLTVQPCAAASYVMADHVRLRQCLLNLVGNAIKFAPRGNVTVKTRVEHRDGVEFVVFDVCDNGVGIAKSDLETVFKPFSQAARVSDTHGGAGLGLSIARDLARAMGGDITVASERNKGSTFSLYVPVPAPGALRAA